VKTFHDSLSRCGEDDDYPPDQPWGEFSGARDCFCSGDPSQNSHAMMTQIFGASANRAPEIAKVSPSDGDAVNVGFVIDAVVYDDRGLEVVSIEIDGVLLGERTALPFRFAAPNNIVEGNHTIKITARDQGGLTTEAFMDVTVQPPCRATTDCPGSDVCSVGSGQCVNGPGEPGGIGSECTISSECDSGLCGQGPGGKRCTSLCTPSGSDCPDAFDCLPAGEQGACWPTDAAIDKGSSDGGCGCQVGGRGRSPAGALALALGVMVVLGLARRRRYF
jgi:MYXO-CTERM domain-containing protein